MSGDSVNIKNDERAESATPPPPKRRRTSELTEPEPILASSSISNSTQILRALALRSAFPTPRPFIALCPSTTRELCSHSSTSPSGAPCPKVHFVRSLRAHTEMGLGDCSYLNTCHRMDTCRYVHWALEDPGPRAVVVPTGIPRTAAEEGNAGKGKGKEGTRGDEPQPLPPQWINADLRSLDVTALGKFHVVVADPPWAIHQELPYGTLTDDEMMRMPVGSMQDEGGLLFLWVTGRAMELGRECLAAWGYERIDELVWVKTNQLQGLIRTGRTGHWLNHSKEHCLVAIRRSPTSPHLSPSLPSWCHKSLDTQVLLAEVRETSRKPDELYDMIERILGGKGHGRKVELFGRDHNLRNGWLTLGNQFGQRDQVFEKDVVDAFNMRYPEREMILSDPDAVIMR